MGMKLPKKQYYMQKGERQSYLDSEGMKQLADEIGTALDLLQKYQETGRLKAFNIGVVRLAKIRVFLIGKFQDAVYEEK